MFLFIILHAIEEHKAQHRHANDLANSHPKPPLIKPESNEEEEELALRGPGRGEVLHGLRLLCNALHLNSFISFISL